MTQQSLVVGIVGATGAVGLELIKCLHKSKIVIKQLRLFASAKSVGTVVSTPFGDVTLEEFNLEQGRVCGLVFLAVSGDFALEFGQKLSENHGPIVIDNSSAFRYFPDIPLVVPEVNGHAIGNARLIANPNCTTAIAAVVLWPLHQQFKIKKIVMSTYQAASGAGAQGMEELLTGTAAQLKGEPQSCSVFAHPLPFNLIPHIDTFQSNGYTKEEMKVVWETRKIFGLKALPSEETQTEYVDDNTNDQQQQDEEDDVLISCTAVRVPTLRAHSEAITIETHRRVTPEAARDILRVSPGVRVVDDPSSRLYPMPLTATESNDVEVGRIRSSLIFGDRGLDLFVSGDQLLRGAALNAVLIAERIFCESV